MYGVESNGEKQHNSALFARGYINNLKDTDTHDTCDHKHVSSVLLNHSTVAFIPPIQPIPLIPFISAVTYKLGQKRSEILCMSRFFSAQDAAINNISLLHESLSI